MNQWRENRKRGGGDSKKARIKLKHNKSFKRCSYNLLIWANLRSYNNSTTSDHSRWQGEFEIDGINNLTIVWVRNTWLWGAKIPYAITRQSPKQNCQIPSYTRLRQDLQILGFILLLYKPTSFQPQEKGGLAANQITSG